VCIFCTQICAGMLGFQCVYSEKQGAKEIKVEKHMIKSKSVSQPDNNCISFSNLCLQKLTFVN